MVPYPPTPCVPLNRLSRVHPPLPDRQVHPPYGRRTPPVPPCRYSTVYLLDLDRSFLGPRPGLIGMSKKRGNLESKEEVFYPREGVASECECLEDLVSHSSTQT